MKYSICAVPPAIITALLLGLTVGTARGQVIIQQDQSPDGMVQSSLAGQDVFISNVRFNGVPGANVAPVGDGPGEIGRFNGSNSNIGLAAGLFLCTNVAMAHLPGPNGSLQRGGGGLGGQLGGASTPESDLSQLSGYEYWEQTASNIFCNAILEFDFVPLNDMVSFRYVFSSEEYERWGCSEFNDVFGWFISGPGITGPFQNNAMNIAFIPGSLSPVSINTVNSGAVTANANGPSEDPFAYCNAADPDWAANTPYYRYNGGQWDAFSPDGNAAQLEAPYNSDPYYIQHNGLTVVLTASAAVQIGQAYRMKMGVANVSDGWFPSAVFIEQNSFQASDRFTLSVDAGPNVDLSGSTPMLHQSTTDSVFLRINRWGGFYLDEVVELTAEGDAVAGVDYRPEVPTNVHFNTLDSAVTIALALPVGTDEVHDLTVSLITGNGQKVQAFPLLIGPQLTTGHGPAPAMAPLAVYPNPADHQLRVALPTGMHGIAELELVDMAGRAVVHQWINGTQGHTMDLSELPNGLYSLKATTLDQMAVTRVSVRH